MHPQYPRPKQKSNFGKWFLIGFTGAALFEYLRNPFWFLVTVFILIAIMVGVVAALLSTWWGILLIGLLIAAVLVKTKTRS